ncbi:hypothetical protein VTJ04DRAFT_6969 [Mycothermus thermophilus]|uniref:uncharacterized protein n=1 Tax=Humicola insolens TaxID=85995 RepID=UPI003743560E
MVSGLRSLFCITSLSEAGFMMMSGLWVEAFFLRCSVGGCLVSVFLIVFCIASGVYAVTQKDTPSHEASGRQMGRAGGVPGHWVGGHDIWLVSVHEFTMDSQLLTVGGFPRRFNDDFTLGGIVLVLSLAHMARTATGRFGRGIWSYLHQPVLDHGLDSLVFCGSRAQDFLVPPDFGRRASRYLFFFLSRRGPARVAFLLPLDGKSEK